MSSKVQLTTNDFLKMIQDSTNRYKEKLRQQWLKDSKQHVFYKDVSDDEKKSEDSSDSEATIAVDFDE